jgi:hypothetical protein
VPVGICQEIATDELPAELDDPFLADDRGQVLEREVRRAAHRRVVLDLVGHLDRVAGVPAGGPHLRARAVGALIRAAARREHRHRLPELDPVDEVVRVVDVEVEEVPRRPRQPVDVARPLGAAVADDLVPAPPADAGQLGRIEVRVGLETREQRGGDVLALAHDDVVDRRLFHRALGQAREVLPAAHDQLVREVGADRMDHRAHRGPAEAPHVGDADGTGGGVDAREDLVVGEAEPHHGPLGRRLRGCGGDRVEHADVVAGFAQRGGHVGEAERRRRPERRQRVRVQVDGRLYELNAHPARGGDLARCRTRLAKASMANAGAPRA